MRRASWRSVATMWRPSERDDLVVLGIALRLEVLEDPLIGGLRHPVEGVEMVEVGELLVLDEALLALGQPLGDLLGQALLARHELGVAAEQDVGAAAGHVGRDRHRALAAGLRDELGFLGVVLRVEHDVLVGAAAGGGAALQAAAVEHASTASPTSRSTRCRPAPGGPSACSSTISVTIASHFSFSVR